MQSVVSGSRATSSWGQRHRGRIAGRRGGRATDALLRECPTSTRPNSTDARRTPGGHARSPGSGDAGRPRGQGDARGCAGTRDRPAGRITSRSRGGESSCSGATSSAPTPATRRRRAGDPGRTSSGASGVGGTRTEGFGGVRGGGGVWGRHTRRSGCEPPCSTKGGVYGGHGERGGGGRIVDRVVRAAGEGRSVSGQG